MKKETYAEQMSYVWSHCNCAWASLRHNLKYLSFNGIKSIQYLDHHIESASELCNNSRLVFNFIVGNGLSLEIDAGIIVSSNVGYNCIQHKDQIRKFFTEQIKKELRL